MITKPIPLTLPEPVWELVDQLAQTLKLRAKKEGRQTIHGTRKILSAILTEVLTLHAEDIQRDYDEARRDRLLVWIAKLNRSYSDPQLANTLRDDGGGTIYFPPEETEGPI